MTDDLENFEKSKKQIRNAREELRSGVCCECGGIMHETGNVYLCQNKVTRKFEDRYQIKCNRCGKIDYFIATIEHLSGPLFEQET